MTLKLGRHEYAPERRLVMAILNRTKDSFYDQGATFGEAEALRRVEQVVAEGADVLDVGGVRAGYGTDVDAAEEIRRTVPIVAHVHRAFPGLAISVDTWRAEVATAVCDAGADLINDTWAGHESEVADVAASYGVGLICSHTGGLGPRTDPYRATYADVVADVRAGVSALADRAVAAGVDPRSVVVDPTHDFGKTTYESLELTRRLPELVDLGWPVLVALSNKDFVGETLDLPARERLSGTLAATAVSAWHGARIFRAHQVAETRQVLDMVSSILGERPPARAIRGLA